MDGGISLKKSSGVVERKCGTYHRYLNRIDVSCKRSILRDGGPKFAPLISITSNSLNSFLRENLLGRLRNQIPICVSTRTKKSMLARRAITRPTISKLTWRSAQAIHLIPRPYTQHLRPEGLWGKCRYRKDGQPRSRLAGAAFGSLIFFNVLTLIVASTFMDESALVLGLLASTICIQQADKSFNQVDLQDPLAILTHFKLLYQAYTRGPPERVDQLFENLTRLMKLAPKDVERQAHDIMRTAAEQIHAAFQDLNQSSISKSATHVVSVMRGASDSLLELVEDIDDDGDTKYAFQLIRDHSKKDSEEVLNEYKLLG